MVTNDGFQPDRPLFLSEPAEEIGQPDIGKVWKRSVISSRILTMSIWAATATAIGIAILSVENPVALVADFTASWVDKPALQPVTDPSTSSIQSIAGTQDSATTTGDAPAREEIAAVSEPADQNQAAIVVQPPATEIVQPPAQALLKEFEAWAAKQDSRAEAVPVEPAQAAPVQVAQAAPVQAQPAKKHRRARSVHNARAEIRPQRIHRVRAREASAPVPIAPVPDARAPELPVQNTQTPSLFQSLGWRN
jgi:hypothetical protein